MLKEVSNILQKNVKKYEQTEYEGRSSDLVPVALKITHVRMQCGLLSCTYVFNNKNQYQVPSYVSPNTSVSTFVSKETGKSLLLNDNAWKTMPEFASYDDKADPQIALFKKEHRSWWIFSAFEKSPFNAKHVIAATSFIFGRTILCIQTKSSALLSFYTFAGLWVFEKIKFSNLAELNVIKEEHIRLLSKRLV